MTMKKPFESLVREYGTTVLKVCRAVVGPIDADDAWSETFLAALKAYPQLPDNANVQAWLVTIAHRKALDTIRRNARSDPVQDVPHGSSQTSSHGNPEDLLEPLAVWEIVQLLPPRQRQVIAYRYLASLSYEEIAHLVGGNAQAARRACADGLNNLRRNHAHSLEH